MQITHKDKSMAIPLNEEIREEARKMSEYVIDDTKRTVEMLNWMKQQNKSPVTEDNSVLGTALKAGADFATGNVLNGVSVLANTILPRLRDRVAKPVEVKEPEIDYLANANRSLTEINDKVVELRDLITEKEISTYEIDDICYDIQVIISDYFKGTK